MTSSGIEPANFLLAAQCLNQLCDRNVLVKPADIAHAQPMSKACMLQFDMTVLTRNAVLVLSDVFVSKTPQ